MSSSFFDGSSHTNASHGTFSSVAGNQVNTTSYHFGLITIQCFYSAPIAQPPLLTHKLSGDLSRPTSGPKVPSTESHVTVYQSSVAIDGMIEATVGHVAKITKLLIDRRVPSNSHLVPELKLLQQTLILHQLAIQAYSGRPLGRTLANTINPAVKQCNVVLQELLSSVSSTWLNSIGIGDSWGSTWWNGWDESELALLKGSLCRVRRPLGEMLLALNSVRWVELGNELYAGRESLEAFHTFLSKNLLFLGHMKLNSVQVVDHLGRIIPVPTQFCSTWKDFDYIINHHCRNRPGSHFVERGDYEVMRTMDGQTISHSEFAVQSGMIVEMAIVMRQSTANQNNKCPRCDHLNLNVTAHSGWIECRECPAQFQVAIDNNNEEQNGKHGEGEGGDGNGRPESGEKHFEENAEENVEDHDEEIISLASRPKPRVTGWSANDGNLQPQDDNGKQFFRRIRVIHNIRSPVVVDPKKQLSSVNSAALHAASIHTTTDLLVGLQQMATCKLDFDSIANGAAKCLKFIVPWEEASVNNDKITVISAMRKSCLLYYDATNKSIKTAQDSYAFCSDIVDLCEFIADPSTELDDLLVYISAIEDKAKRSHMDSTKTVEIFRIITHHILLEVKKLGKAEDYSEGVIFNLKPFSKKTGNNAGLNKRELGCEAAVAELRQTASALAQLSQSVDEFAYWWSAMGTFLNAGKGFKLVGPQSRVLIRSAERSWRKIQADSLAYKVKLVRLQDYFGRMPHLAA